MKRLDSKTVAQSRKRLVLKRETLRRLEAGELQNVVGGITDAASCTCTITTKKVNNEI